MSLLASLCVKRSTSLTALITAPAALLLTAGRAEAILTFNIFDSGVNQITLEASGSITLPSSSSGGSIVCEFPGGKLYLSNPVRLCTGGSNLSLPAYNVTGPSSLLPSVQLLSPSSPPNVTGLPINLAMSSSVTGTGSFAISTNYASGNDIASSALFDSTQTVSQLGFAPGLIGSWQLAGVEGDAGRIDLFVGPRASVPGPLPLFGAAAAFGWSRTLRRRISASRTSNA